MHDPRGSSPFDTESFHHTGIVVRDIEKAIDHLESLGMGPFRMRDGRRWVDVVFRGDLHGQPAEWSVKISNAQVGDHEIELLQPCGGASVLQEFLDEHGEGVHHIAYLVDDVRGSMERLAGHGLEVLTSANLDTRGFAYLRTGQAGVVVEIRFR